MSDADLIEFGGYLLASWVIGFSAGRFQRLCIQILEKL